MLRRFWKVGKGEMSADIFALKEILGIEREAGGIGIEKDMRDQGHERCALFECRARS
jgi:hypothetical protein